MSDSDETRGSGSASGQGADGGALPPTPPDFPPSATDGTAGDGAPSADADTGSAVTVPAAQAALEAGGPNWLVGLREATTTGIAAVLVIVTMVMLWRTFQTANGFDQEKDILNYALPLLGTVLGYYFGRVPAERRAEVSEGNLGAANRTAESERANATETKKRSEETLNQVKIGVERAKAKLEASGGPAGGGARGVLSPTGGGSAGGNAAEAYAELDAISSIL